MRKLINNFAAFLWLLILFSVVVLILMGVLRTLENLDDGPAAAPSAWEKK